MKKKTVFIISAAILILLLLFVLFLREIDNQKINSIRIITGNESVALHYSDGCYYAFLPSFSDMDSLTVNYPDDCSLFFENEYFMSGSVLKNVEAEKKYHIEIKNVFGIKSTDTQLVFMKSENMNSMFLSLTNGTIEDVNESADKSVKRSGSCRMIDSTGDIRYNGNFSAIKGRGNTTWNSPKKPYDLVFENKADLLGSGKKKRYCLLANDFDETNIRNKIVYDTALKSVLKYSLNSDFVDLYIDGEYKGLYLLTEDITAGSDCIDIYDLEADTQSFNDKNLKDYPIIETYIKDDRSNGIEYKYHNIPNDPENITGGYIIELCNNYRIKNAESAFSSLIKNYGYKIKAPEYASKNQVEYIKEFVGSFETSKNDVPFDELIDTDTWIDFYIIHEVFANNDVSSMFFYKDKDSKLYAGPVWDFDLSMGQYFGETEPCPDILYRNQFFLFKKLYNDTSCYEKIRSRYNEFFRNELTNLCESRIHEYCSKIAGSFEMNKIRWKDSKKKTWVRKVENIEQAEQEIKGFLTKRKEFLDSVWIDGKEPPVVVFMSSMVDNDINTRKNFYFAVERGCSLTEIPELEYEGKEFLGWYENTTGEKININEPIEKNRYFSARWK